MTREQIHQKFQVELDKDLAKIKAFRNAGEIPHPELCRMLEELYTYVSSLTAELNFSRAEKEEK